MLLLQTGPSRIARFAKCVPLKDGNPALPTLGKEDPARERQVSRRCRSASC